jgi:hypothetical protein
MNAISIHIQRKFEQRWAARFVSTVALAAPKGSDSKGTDNSSPRPEKTREKPAELSERT